MRCSSRGKGRSRNRLATAATAQFTGTKRSRSRRLIVTVTQDRGPVTRTIRGMEAAFFDLDKTVIDRASIAAFGRPFLKGGLINRRMVARAAISQLIYLYFGADEDRLVRVRESMDAISLSTLDVGMRGFDGGLWTSDLGIRYIEVQREAIARKIRIRRVFVFADAEMALDEAFQRITQVQREIGVEVRMLYPLFIPDWLRSMIFDFIVFDGTVSYETTPATAFAVGETRPGILRTLLAPTPERVHELEERFEQLWNAADPNRKIDE